MTSFADLVNDVYMVLEGYGLDQGRAAFVAKTGGISATDLSFTVDNTANVGPGIAEIGDELVFIQSVDDTTKTVTISPDGRGYRGTAATTHVQNARITGNPLLPRSLVKRKVNETIVGTYPTLYGVASTTLTYSPIIAGYEVPSDLEDVLQVTLKPLGPSKDWERATRFRVDHNPDPGTFTTGKVLNLFDGAYPGSSVRVVYQKVPTELTNDADDLTDVSGLQKTARAAIVAGAAWRLVSFMDASRLRVDTVDVSTMADKVPMGAGTQISSYLRKQYEVELADEQARQQVANPPLMHFID